MKITISENNLKQIVTESVKKVLTELDWKTYANAARKWADTLEKNPAHPKRKSNIMGHEKSKSDHDIPTDNRLRGFKDAARDAFNKEYSFNQYGRNNDKGTYEMSFDTDNIGAHGYYDSLGTETHVPGRLSVVGKTKDGERTQSILRDRFNMDSFDGRDKYPGNRHEARIGFDKKRVSRGAVEPDMDRWDYMAARNKGNQEILHYVNGDYDYVDGKWVLDGKIFDIFSEDNAPEGSVRPPFCYAHGQLEDDLGFDLFLLDKKIKKVMPSNENMMIGVYKCRYNGKPCSLYVGYSKNGGPNIPTGLACYDDDEDAKKYIVQQLDL